MDADTITPEAVHLKQKEAESRVSYMTTDEWKHLRWLCKTNLFFLCYSILGYTKLSENLHGHLSAWTIRNRAARFRMMLLARAHYKTTVLTQTDAIRIVLPDDVGDQPWPECLGTNCRLLIAHETQEQASKILFPITAHFTSNTLLMGLFPECVPNPREHRINKQELELPRSEIWSEPTIDTMGVGGKSQGRHYNYLKLDDLIGDKARDSKAEMETAIDWFDNIQSFFSEFTRDKFDVIGTRYATRDLYQHIMETYGPAILKYIRPVEERDTVTNELKPIFPEKFTPESLAILRKNRKVWIQYSNNPEDLDNTFDSAWLKFYNLHKPSGKIVVFMGIEKRIFHPQECDIVILFDPAMSGSSGILVTAGDKDGNQFILEAIKEGLRPPESCALIFRLVQRYRPRTVAIEEVLFSGLFKHWFESEMKLRNIRFHITPVKTRGKEKDARVRGVTNYFASGKIYIQQEHLDFIQEYKEFGSGTDYHLLDALAYGPEVWRKPLDQKVWNRYRELEQELLDQRDVLTGY
jgi:predicted phage terminase large subunit-like protein